MDLVFLHGFLSSPQSSKIQSIPRYLRSQGFSIDSIVAIDLYPTKDEFEKMTVSDLLQNAINVLEQLHRPVLIGSSHGGLLALLLSYQRPDLVDRQILIAPAIYYYDRLQARHSLSEWRSNGSLPITYERFGGLVHLGSQYIEDLSTYKMPPPVIKIPTLIIHGTDDQLVPVSDTDRYINQIDSDEIEINRIAGGNHRLSNAIDQVNTSIASWLGDGR